MPALQVDLLTPPEKNLLVNCLEQHFQQESAAYLAPLRRVGRSGAKLFLLKFREGGVSYVVKVHKKREIKREAGSIEQVKTWFPDCDGILPPYYFGQLGVIIYRHKGGTDEDSFLLDDVLYPRLVAANDPPMARQLMDGPTQAIVKKLDTLFTTKCKHRLSLATVERALIEEYEWYLRDHRKKFRADVRIMQMLGKQARNLLVKVLGCEVLNPVLALNKGFRAVKKYRSATIHGDLHPNNIVIDNTGTPHLIDFAWARREAHVLKDFVLLENSIRFRSFPRYCDEQLHEGVDDLLLEDHGHDKIPGIVGTRGLAAVAFDRMAAMVGAVRTHARKAYGGKMDFNEYLAAQFLVLYGLMKFDDYNSPIVLRALGACRT